LLIASVAAGAGVPVFLAALGIGAPPAAFGYFAGEDSMITDKAGDAQAIFQQNEPGIVPEVKPHHDVLSASVRRGEGFFVFVIDLAGDPNLNEKYETNYMWHIIYPDSSGQEKHYVIMFLNFAPGFNYTSQGWFYAVFDRTIGSYTLGQTKIPDMIDTKVQYPVDSSLVGNPQSFRYWVSVHTRVNNTTFEYEPEYLMDLAP
jgi:hypothetical protein